MDTDLSKMDENEYFSLLDIPSCLRTPYSVCALK